MNITRSIGRTAAVLAAVSALAALAGVAEAGTSRPHSSSEGQDRALLLRSEALNEKYGLGSQRATRQGMTAADRALMIRSEALNQKYALGEQKGAALASQPANSPRGFAWGAFAIGAAVMFGVALLAGGVFVRRRLLATLRGLTPRHRTT